MFSIFSKFVTFVATITTSLLTVGNVTPSIIQTNDPTVIVVRDVTSISKCSLQVNKQQRRACPAGTILHTFHVLLAEAQHNHEQYVIIPSHSSSSTIQAQTKQAIFALFASTRQHFRVNLLPMTSCGQWNSMTIQYYEYYTHDLLENALYWSIPTSNCNDVALEDISMEALNIKAPVYWDHDQYDTGSWGRGCAFVSNSWNPHSLFGATYGKWYNYQTYTATGSNCTIFDNYSYINMGPLE